MSEINDRIAQVKANKKALEARQAELIASQKRVDEAAAHAAELKAIADAAVLAHNTLHQSHQESLLVHQTQLQTHATAAEHLAEEIKATFLVSPPPAGPTL